MEACAAIWRAFSSVPPSSKYAVMPVPRKVWLQTSVVMPAALACRRTMAQALVRWSRTPFRTLFDHLVTGAVLEHNPALTAKAPRQKLGKGKAPVAGELLRSVENDTVIGLRDRALIGVMVFTFARISAACGLNVADIFHQQRRLWVRLHEKGGKFHEMPCHHTLESYLAEYIERARLAEAGRATLFQAIRYRPYGREEAVLAGQPLRCRRHRAGTTCAKHPRTALRPEA